MRVGYAAQNGHPYSSIGKELIDRGALHPEGRSPCRRSGPGWRPIRTRPGSDGEERLLRLLPGDRRATGPLGAEGVPLTPGRSLAVDRKHCPRRPVWLAAGMPAPRRGRARPQAPPPPRRPGHRRRHPRPGARRRLLGVRPRGRSGRRADEAPGEAVGAAAEKRDSKGPRGHQGQQGPKRLSSLESLLSLMVRFLQLVQGPLRTFPAWPPWPEITRSPALAALALELPLDPPALDAQAHLAQGPPAAAAREPLERT